MQVSINILYIFSPGGVTFVHLRMRRLRHLGRFWVQQGPHFLLLTMSFKRPEFLIISLAIISYIIEHTNLQQAV